MDENLKFIVDQIVSAVIDGQPICRVVGNTYDRAIELKKMIENELTKKEIKFNSNKILTQIETDTTTITFHSQNHIRTYMRGKEKYNCQFWDSSTLVGADENNIFWESVWLSRNQV
jgi:uncharacterized protein YajQ (UPF0234 family)